MNSRGKVIGVSALAFALIATVTLVVRNKPVTTGVAELGPAIPPEASALDEYLAHPPVVENSPWKGMIPPHETIPIHLKEFADGPTDYERAIAIGCLAFTVQQMATVPATQDAAKEALVKWVIPHVNLTKVLPPTCGYGWRESVLASRNAYKFMGDHAGTKACLILLRDQAEKQTDREMAVYLMAYDLAQARQFQEAIQTFNTLPKESKWADQRPRIIGIWQKKQADEEKAKKQTPEALGTKP